MVSRKAGGGIKRSKPKEWDPNASDSNDETYNDTEARSAHKTTRSSQRSKKSRTGKSRSQRKRNSYSDDDDEEDGESEEITEISDIEEEPSEDSDAPVSVNRSGRPVRRAAVKPQTYEESDPDEIKDEILEPEQTPPPPPEQSKIIKLKLTHTAGMSQQHAPPATPTVTRRTTRASSKEPTSVPQPIHRPPSSAGRSVRGASVGASGTAASQRPARSTRQNSAGPGKGRQGSAEPANPLGRRSSRLHPELEAEDPLVKMTNSGNIEFVHAKPLLKQPSTVQEEEEENSGETESYHQPQAGDIAKHPIETSTEAVYGGSLEVENAEGDQDAPGEDEEDDELPTQRSRRKNTMVVSEQPSTPSPRGTRRSKAPSTVSPVKSRKSPMKTRRAAVGDTLEPPPTTRRGGSRGGSQTKGSDDDDWQAEEEESDTEMSGTDASISMGKSAKKPFVVEDDNEEGSEPGRRSTRGKGSQGGGVSKRKRNASEEELDLAEELADLQDSPGTRKSKRRAAAKEDDLPHKPKLRERTSKVDYRIINPELQVFGDDMLNTPIGGVGGFGGGTKAGTSKSIPTLYATSGPFGGWGAPTPIFGKTPFMGPTLDSDSSDDDELQRNPRKGGLGAAPFHSTARGTQPNLLPPTVMPTGVDAIGAMGAVGATNTTARKANADTDSLGIDQNVTFESVGGHEEHIRQLREMVALPLMYPEIFKEFGITPPKGVLFHGPPGTGKTLMARALASSCSTQTGKKVTFFMRKGADCLSKWVGEAERQLRLLFEEAKNAQPSIIFFDEIDGLAPVRSAKQDQIHASIVSTLLALMDGMDGRGQIIVIGATNRPDAVDPALRRPGRFDREFYFPLPDVDARKKIIDIHTKNWNPLLSEDFKKELAVQTKGFGGADLRGMCTEAALNAVQRVYPQLYTSWDRYIIDAKKIKVTAADFLKAIKKIVPSSERSTSSGAAPLPKHIAPLLQEPLNGIEKAVQRLLPRTKKMTVLEEAMYEDDVDPARGFEREKMMTDFENARVFRPRLLIHGPPGMGQQYLGAALLHHFEGFHVQNFDMATLQSDPLRPPEASVIQYFVEVKRHKPSIIFIPNIDTWYNTMTPAVVHTFTGLLRSIPPSDPIMLIGIVETPLKDLNLKMLQDFFGYSKANRYQLRRPDHIQRESYFKPLVSHIKKSPRDFPDPTNRPRRVLEVLEKAPPPPPHIPTPEELEAQAKRDGQVRNWLRLGLMGWIDSTKQRYKRLKKPIIDHALLANLGKEPEPPSNELVVSDIPAPVHQPYELTTDKHGSPMILEVETGKKYYNIDVDIIEIRISNGYYCLPRQFLEDVRLVAIDAQTLGTDKDRILKANEMVANAEVFVTDLETKDPNWLADCEKLYQRHLEKQRQKESKRAEKEAKKAAETTASIHAAAAVESMASGGSSNGISNGGSPRKAGSPSKPLAITNILVPSTPAKQVENSSSNNTSLTNGVSHSEHSSNSQPQNMETQDVEMGNSLSSSGSYSTSAFHTAPPSSHPTHMHFSQVAGSSAMAHIGAGFGAAGAAGKAPIGPLINDSPAPSRLSSQRTSGGSIFTQNTQSTNGRYSLGSNLTPSFHEFDGISSADSQLPDTQVLSSSEGSGGQASQAYGVYGSQPLPSQLHSYPMHSSSYPQSLPANFGSNTGEFKVPDLMRVIIDIEAVEQLPTEIATRTSGFSVEQLEQVNAALMETIWAHRGQWDKEIVLREVKNALEDVLHDIGDMQPLLPTSMEEAGDLEEE